MIRKNPASGNKSGKLQRAIERLENRAYLSGAVFGPPNSFATAPLGLAPIYLNVDDLAGNGKADLIVGNAANGTVANSVSILPGNGDGTFGTPQTIPLSFSPLTIIDAPLGTNGKQDIAVGSSSNNTVGVILQSNSGTFSEQDYTATGLVNTQSVTIGDFNGDGHPDIAVASSDGGTTNNVAIFFNNGDGTFTLHQVLSVPQTHVVSITSFAVTGGTDLAVANRDSNSVTILTDLAGTFSVGNTYSVGSGPVSIKAGQFDKNSNNNFDLVTSNSTGGGVSVLLGNGDGTFQSTAINTAVAGVPAGGGTEKVRVATVDNSGNPAVLVLLSPGSTSDAEVLLGNGDGTFHVGNTFSSNDGVPDSMAAGDLNADGLTDLAIASPSQITTFLNVTNQDHTPPTAAVDVSQPAPVTGSPTIQFTVTYSDNTAVDATTLQTGNLTVTAPNSTVQTATLVSSNLANGANVTATYQINAPSGALSSADNGAYTVTATSNLPQAVKDVSGNALAGGNIGVFNVQVPLPNGPNLVAGPVLASLPANVIAGTLFRGLARITITNSGTALAAGKMMVLNLYASPDATIRGNAPLLESITRAVHLLPNHKAVYVFRPFKWPAALTGAQFLVARINATDSIAETNLADDVGISAKSTLVQPPFVDIQNLWNQKFPANFIAGRREVLVVLVQNNGNVLAHAKANVTVQASVMGNTSDAVSMFGPVQRFLLVAPHHRQVIPVVFKVPALASGSYHIIVTVSYPGDTDPGNDTVVSTSTFSI